MADSDPTSVILGSVFIIVGTTLIRKEVEQKGSPQAGSMVGPVIFGFALTVALLAVAIPAPGFARGLAYMGMVGAFAVNGPTLFTTINKLGAKQA